MVVLALASHWPGFSSDVCGGERELRQPSSSRKIEAAFFLLTLKLTVNIFFSALVTLFSYFVDGLNSKLL